ncbi:MAG: PAS domain S-box protein [Phycisphaerae bacterium]
MSGSSQSAQPTPGRLRPLRISLGYAAVGCFWILATDPLLHALVPEGRSFAGAEIVKGLFFVLATGSILYWLLRRQALRFETFHKVLQERESRYRTVFESSSDGLILRELDGTILDANPAFCRMHGYSLEELRGTRVVRLIHPDHQHLFETCSAELARHGHCSLRAMHLRKDRTAFAVEISANQFEQDGVPRVLSVVREITDRVQAERQLRESQRFLRAALDAMLSLVAILDDRGRILTVNAAWRRFAEAGRGPIHLCEPGDDYLGGCENMTGDGAADAARLAAGIRDVIDRKTETFAHEYACGEGQEREWFYVRASRFEGPGPTRVVVAHVNITQRRRAEETARAVARQQAAIAELGHLALTGTPVNELMNQAVRLVVETLGVEYSTVLECTPDRKRLFFRAVHTTSRPLPEGATVSADDRSQSGYTLLTGGPVIVEDLSRETRFVPSELMREMKVVSCISTVIPGQAGPVGVLGAYAVSRRLFSRDDAHFLTALANVLAAAIERQKADEALARQAQELSRSNTELERFAYIASHDLQEPLRMVGSYTQLLARRYRGRLDADADEFIGYIVDGVAQMQALINDLLAFSRVGSQAKPFVPTDCEAVLDRALSHLHVAIQECGAVVTRDPLPTVQADPTQLGQLFQNLIGNAVKFRGESPPEIHVSASCRGGEWVFSVRDNGIGIEAEYFERIFVLFQRLHGRMKYPGTGIGLTICKKIVERHGGRIWVESEVGRGSTFYFTLSAAAPGPREPELVQPKGAGHAS